MANLLHIQALKRESLSYPLPAQILTIAGLLSGSQRAEYYDLAMGSLNFKKATVEETDQPNQASLF